MGVCLPLIVHSHIYSHKRRKKKSEGKGGSPEGGGEALWPFSLSFFYTYISTV